MHPLNASRVPSCMLEGGGYGVRCGGHPEVMKIPMQAWKAGIRIIAPINVGLPLRRVTKFLVVSDRLGRGHVMSCLVERAVSCSRMFWAPRCG